MSDLLCVPRSEKNPRNENRTLHADEVDPTTPPHRSTSVHRWPVVRHFLDFAPVEVLGVEVPGVEVEVEVEVEVPGVEVLAPPALEVLGVEVEVPGVEVEVPGPAPGVEVLEVPGVEPARVCACAYVHALACAPVRAHTREEANSEIGAHTTFPHWPKLGLHPRP